MAIWDDGTGKIWIVSGGNPFDATQATLEGCCCCAPCCENPWRLCVTVTDGVTTAKALVGITTTLSDCCCTGTAIGNLCLSDGTNVGQVQVELIATHDSVFARFTVVSTTFAPCPGPLPGGCVSAWVEGVSTGTAPSGCTITFALTIARNGTTPLTVSATDSFTEEECYACDLAACPSDCTPCASQYQVVCSGFPDSTIGYGSPGVDPCWRWNYLNGTFTLVRSSCGWYWSGYNGGVDECNHFNIQIVCVDLSWRFEIYPYNSYSGWNIKFGDTLFRTCPSNGVWPYLSCNPRNVTVGECVGWNCNGSVAVVTVTAT